MTATTTTVLQTCLVEPPPTSPAVSLPLSFLDVIWLHFHPIRRLLFYPNRCSTAYFLETLVPNLKHSLSLALQHYLPLSGNLLYPSDTQTRKPYFRYLPGDSVSFTVAVSENQDFDNLVANHPRDADMFYDFAPEMPPHRDEPDYKVIPVLTIRITLFPGRGLCLGFANHHTIADGNSIFRFMKSWASISRLGEFTDCIIPPVFDRSAIKDPLEIDSIFWKKMREIPITPSSFPLPTNRVRSTFTLRPTDIMKLKELVLSEKPGLSQVSSFVVTTSYIWVCLVKSAKKTGEKELPANEIFAFTVDLRGRLDPPVPDYFGNCLSYGKAGLTRDELIGEGGFVMAAEAMTEDIKNRVNKKDEVLKGAENWMTGWDKFGEMSFMGVSGSPRFDLCGLDFGWGRGRKLEVLSIDGESYSMSLCKSGDCDGGLEVGMSLAKERMEDFAALFAEGLAK